MLAPGVPLSDWLTWLETLSPTEIDLGLERVRLMLGRLEPALPEHVLLIAGTNGKGSSVAMSAALLRASGKRVGAYSSPHLNRYSERIVVDGIEAADADIIAAFERIEALRDDLPLTYFEFGTLAAIEIFAGAKLDVWILEVGLGGRLDATNAIDPGASLITNVSLDHCAWLGDNVETIAAEKAGVMRSGIATVFADRSVPRAIVQTAAVKGAKLLLCGRDFEVSMNEDQSWNWRGAARSFDALRPPGLVGEFQIRNAAGVLALLEAAGLGAGLDRTLVDRVLAKLELPGRSQRVHIDDEHWIFDVAHNPAAAAVLAATLASETCRGATIAVVGLLDDKDVNAVIGPLAPLVDRWIAVSAESRRAIPANELARQIANLSGRACVVAGTLQEAIDYSRQKAAENDRILVTGSFHAVGPALACLDLNPRPET